MAEEIWKDVAGYEGLYQISDHGRLKRVSTKGSDKIIRPYQKDKYLKTELWKDGKRKKVFVHRLVAEHFLPNPAHFPQVNHKDENPENNHVSNLEFCNPKYNANYGTRNQRSALSQSKKVEQYTVSGELLHEYPSIKIAAKCAGLSRASICIACNRQRVSGGYLWKYAEDKFTPMVVEISGNPLFVIGL